MLHFSIKNNTQINQIKLSWSRMQPVLQNLTPAVYAVLHISGWQSRTWAHPMATQQQWTVLVLSANQTLSPHHWHHCLAQQPPHLHQQMFHTTALLTYLNTADRIKMQTKPIYNFRNVMQQICNSLRSMLHMFQKRIKWKSARRRRKYCALTVVRWSHKNFAPLQTPFRGRWMAKI